MLSAPSHLPKERYNETMLNAYNLYALSICHVCGSYQCPYCPVYSHTTSYLNSVMIIYLLLPVLSSALYLIAVARKVVEIDHIPQTPRS